MCATFQFEINQEKTMEINNLTRDRVETDKILTWSSVIIKNNHNQMETTRPLILVSNDDGVMAKGVNLLIEYLRPIADIIAVVPDKPRSGSGSAITSDMPVTYSLVKREVGVTMYKCTGTPADCIKLALGNILTRTPDLIVGGINHGDNASVNVHYSGTMAIAIEGALCGIPSIGFSLCTHDKDADFSPTKQYVRAITMMVLKRGLPALTCLNVNFPSSSKYKGVKVTSQARGRWTQEWEQMKRYNGTEHFWLTGTFIDNEEDANNPSIDRTAIRDEYVAITPVKVDVTDYEYIEQLKQLCEEGGL